ncbi:hypothetical protein T11_11187 [Trichinella zimbabwensis]|uniref:Uncharacterized protein n=1 Tax=Trichinella zimbabwensis TaxID=268475 RepID=A0A0V1H3D8_9BILA|nr:hypothetical protein T11_11187 [Trichinella zimbabwensis]
MALSQRGQRLVCSSVQLPPVTAGDEIPVQRVFSWQDNRCSHWMSCQCLRGHTQHIKLWSNSVHSDLAKDFHSMLRHDAHTSRAVGCHIVTNH